MSQPAFDTHQAVTTLAKAKPGLPLAEAIVDTIGAAVENVADKDDIKHIKDDIKQINGRLDSLQKDMDGRLDNMKESIDNTNSRIDNLAESMKTQFDASHNKNVRLVVGSFLTAAALVAAVNTLIQFL